MTPSRIARVADVSRPAYIAGVARMPAGTVEFSGLDRVDFADRATQGTGRRLSAEKWARVMLGDAPSRLERLIWHGVLRNRLEPVASRDTVAGWRIGHREDHRVRLETNSPILGAAILVEAAGDEVSMTTCIRFDTARGRGIWTALYPIHRLVMPRLVGVAVGG